MIPPRQGSGEEKKLDKTAEKEIFDRASDRLGEFCDMVEHICGKYREIAERRSAVLREKFGL